MADMRTIREALKLTQVELAERLGVHQTTVSRFETGELPLDRRTELALLALRDGSEPASKAA
jgi:transcriptional regulator with XRE-family HTH domain